MTEVESNHGPTQHVKWGHHMRTITGNNQKAKSTKRGGGQSMSSRMRKRGSKGNMPLRTEDLHLGLQEYFERSKEKIIHKIDCARGENKQFKSNNASCRAKE